MPTYAPVSKRNQLYSKDTFGEPSRQLFRRRGKRNSYFVRKAPWDGGGNPRSFIGIHRAKTINRNLAKLSIVFARQNRKKLSIEPPSKPSSQWRPTHQGDQIMESGQTLQNRVAPLHLSSGALSQLPKHGDKSSSRAVRADFSEIRQRIEWKNKKSRWSSRPPQLFFFSSNEQPNLPKVCPNCPTTSKSLHNPIHSISLHSIHRKGNSVFQSLP